MIIDAWPHLVFWNLLSPINTLQGPETEEIENRLGFLSFSIGVLLFFSFVFFSFLDHVLGLRDSERKRKIDVIDGDNLCKGVSFLLHCNLLHLYMMLS